MAHTYIHIHTHTNTHTHTLTYTHTYTNSLRERVLAHGAGHLRVEPGKPA